VPVPDEFFVATFPGPENVMFSDLELVDIIVTMMPQKWQHQMAKSLNFEPTEATLEELQTALEKLELLDDVEVKNGSNHQDKFKENKDGKGKSKQGSKGPFKKKFKSENGKTSCSLCTLLGGKPDTHTLEDCFFKDKVKRMWKSGAPSKKPKPFNKKSELNALIQKKATKMIKRSFKRSGIDYVEETSSSDSSADE